MAASMVDSLLPLMPKKQKNCWKEKVCVYQMVDGLWSKFCKIANEFFWCNVRSVHLMMSLFLTCKDPSNLRSSQAKVSDVCPHPFPANMLQG